MLRKLFLTLSVATLARFFAVAQDIHSAQVINPFNLGPNSLGAISNSVNLFTGDLALPMNLISFPGRDVGIDVSIFYSSTNIETQSSTWNLEAPTSILGLGWSMQTSKIIVDNKQTAAREDDEFYLSENGSSMRLICIGNASGVKTFATKLFSNKIITYTAATERWDVTLDNGTKVVYGDQNSGRNSVQWAVTWGNWIGNANQFATARQGLIWSLSEVTNVWGDKVYYTYQNTENQLGSSGFLQTEASYLSMITDTQGHEVDFIYKTKLAEEFMEPNTGQNEPDAYQERYERQYLDKINVKADGTFYYEIDFRYTFQTGTVSFGNITKRLLTSIIKVSSGGLQAPGMTFGYQTGEPMIGAMNSITTPNAGMVSFEYSPSGVLITHPSARAILTAPTGYSEPMVFTADDYTVVTWRQNLNGVHGSHDMNAEPIKVMAYAWEGEWMGVDLSSNMFYSQVKKLTSATGPQDFLLATGKDFFAILMQDYTASQYFDLHIWKRSETAAGGWIYFGDQVLFSTGFNAAKKQLFAGNNFIAVSDNNGYIYRYTWSGSGWLDEAPIKEQVGSHFTVAANNYIISHNAVPNPDAITFYYLDAQMNWATPVTVSSTFDISSSANASWYAANSHAVVLPDGLHGFDYRWDQNYTPSSFAKTDLGFAYNSTAPVYVTESLIGIGKTSTNTGRALRYNGTSWVDSGEKTAGYPPNFYDVFGDDLFAWITPNQYSLFNPNSNTWTATNTSYANSTLIIGNGYNIFNSTFNFTKQDGSWSNVTLSSPFVDGGLSFPGPRYFVNNGYMFYIKNGTIQGTNILSSYSPNIYFPTINTCCGDPFLYLGGVNSIALASTYNYFYDCTSLTLLHANPATLNNSTFTDYPIDKITSFDGAKNYYTSFKYEPSTAITDPSISVTQYNKVTTIKGSSSVASTPYGYTESYFFNGLPNSEINPSNDVNYIFPNQTGLSSYTNATSNFKILTGQMYRTKSFDASPSPNVVSLTELSFSVTPVALLNSNGTGKGVGYNYQALLNSTVNTQDNIQTISNKLYTSVGLLSQQQDYTNVNGTQKELVTTSYRYSGDVYTASAKVRNILTTPVQVTKNVNGNQDIVSTGTQWYETWPCTSPTCPSSTVPAPYKQYTWTFNNGTSGTASAFSFYYGNPPTSDWAFESWVSQRDAYNGVEIELQGKGSQVKSQIWDVKRRSVLASAVNANVNLTAYSSFEDASQGNWSWGSDCSIVTGNSKTGNNYLNLGATGVTKTGLSTTGTYTVSFWALSNGGSVNISGVSGSVSIGNVSTWTLFQYNVTNLTSLTLSLSGSTAVQIDELRILPSSAQMSTTTYHPLFGPTSKTDANNQSAFILYDGLGRPVNSVDENGNIVGNKIYNNIK